MRYFEDVAGTIRRMIAEEVEIDPSQVGDDFRWLDSFSADDAGWFLASVQKHFADSALCSSNMDSAALECIATVGSLIRHVESELASQGYQSRFGTTMKRRLLLPGVSFSIMKF
jgi:hypothetical protein